MRLEGRRSNRGLMILSAKLCFVLRKSGDAMPRRRAFARQKTGAAVDSRPRRRDNRMESAISACVKVCGCRPHEGGAADTLGPAYANLQWRKPREVWKGRASDAMGI